MKRWLIYAAALGAALLFNIFPFQSMDIAKLAPVEAVWITDSGDSVYLETDTGDVGVGTDVESALQDMKAKASGIIFLETADYLIVEQGDESILSQVYSVFRPSCKVCCSSDKPDLKECAAFLSAHEPKVTLQQIRASAIMLPMLKQAQGRMELLEQ